MSEPAIHLSAKRFICFILFVLPDSYLGSGHIFLNCSFLLSVGTFSEEPHPGNGGRVTFERRLGNGRVTAQRFQRKTVIEILATQR